jgi:hypothetical protein
MTKLLLMAAAIGLTVSGAGACDYQKSVRAKVDPTTVASVATTESARMSTAAPTADTGNIPVLPEAKTE